VVHVPRLPKFAQACQNGHITPWPAGKTHLGNIASECIHHHQCKTEKFFTVTRTRIHTKTGGPNGTNGGGSVHWTTDSGHTVTRVPRPLPRGGQPAVGASPAPSQGSRKKGAAPPPVVVHLDFGFC